MTAMQLICEIGDFSRVKSALVLMGYLGVIPSQHSSGSTARYGGIAKIGFLLIMTQLTLPLFYASHPGQLFLRNGQCTDL